MCQAYRSLQDTLGTRPGGREERWQTVVGSRATRRYHPDYSECRIVLKPFPRRYSVWSEGEFSMPERETIERAQEDAREGKSPSTQGGEFVREEIHHVREGKHGARSPQQAIAIGLSKARRAGVKLGTPKGPASVRKKAEQDIEAGERPRHRPARKRSRATSGALKRESKKSASRRAVSGQAKRSSAKRGKRARSAAAMKAAHTRRAA